MSEQARAKNPPCSLLPLGQIGDSSQFVGPVRSRWMPLRRSCGRTARSTRPARATAHLPRSLLTTKSSTGAQIFSSLLAAMTRAAALQESSAGDWWQSSREVCKSVRCEATIGRVLRALHGATWLMDSLHPSQRSTQSWSLPTTCTSRPRPCTASLIARFRQRSGSGGAGSRRSDEYVSCLQGVIIGGVGICAR